MSAIPTDENHTAEIYIGCAGWSLPKPWQGEFASTGSHLERYASRFNAVEINSSFYRPHQEKTYRRWAASVPESFRFAVKIPKAITHEARLQASREMVAKFVDEAAGLGAQLGCWLVQLPPSLRFEASVAEDFFALFQECAGELSEAIVCEPRHASWFSAEATNLFAERRVARAAADPAVVPEAAEPGGFSGLVYMRLHGAPRTYYSPYSAEQIRQTATRLGEFQRQARESWCIFDNTADGAATGNALELVQRWMCLGNARALP